jgi:hypothetical protein
VKLLSLAQVANEWGVHRATVNRWVSHGIHGERLAALRVGGRLKVREEAAADFFARIAERATGDNIPAVESAGDVMRRVEAARAAIRAASKN